MKTDVLYLDTAARAASGSAFSQRLSAAAGCVYPISDIVILKTSRHRVGFIKKNMKAKSLILIIVLLIIYIAGDYIMFNSKRTKEKNIISWLNNFYILKLSKMPTLQVLYLLSEDLSIGIPSEITEKISDDLKSGIPLNESLKKYKNYFGNLYLIFLSAENSDNFTETIKTALDMYKYLYSNKIKFYDSNSKIENKDGRVVEVSEVVKSINENFMQFINTSNVKIGDKIYLRNNNYNGILEFEINNIKSTIKQIDSDKYINYIVRLSLMSGLEYYITSKQNGFIIMKIKNTDIKFNCETVGNIFEKNVILTLTEMKK